MGSRNHYRRVRNLAALTCVVLGGLLVFPAHTPTLPVRWSYDLLQLLLPSFDGPPPLIVYMDEQAVQDYQQKPGRPWSRAVHARLLDRLTRDRASVVVFDVTLTQAGDPEEDRLLAEAMHRNGRVVLAGDRVPTPEQRGYTLVPPFELFERNSADWGIAKVHIDPDRVCRRYDPGDDQRPGLAWAAAGFSGAAIARSTPTRLSEELWLNYYGSGRPFEGASMTYSNAESRPAGFFTDRAVFIGGKPETPLRGETTDVFGTPFTHWTGGFTPGVDVTAIAYTNLLYGGSLRRASFLVELALLILTAGLYGWAIQGVPRMTAVWRSLGVAFVVMVGAVFLVLLRHLWIPWIVVSVVQLLCALGFRVLLPPEGESAERAERRGESPKPAAEAVPLDSSAQLRIPNHTLIRCIGEGAYGQVWLARNEIGLYHAVKVIYRNRFGTEEPYQRAFRGIQKFMPISRSEKGFVHILHVGLKDPEGCFFYIMEVGDDEGSGQQIDPAGYVPRTLASELKRRGSLPVPECLNVMLAITEAVDQLHRHRLVHRDIKPANILFVGGHPKLADIDLVTDLSPAGEVSRIGTEGYLAPEGPGTAAADVYSLGRVLYVALTGKRPDQCPELPTRIGSQDDAGLVMEVNQIVCRACDTELARRYPSAARMREDLLKLRERLG